MTVVSIKTGPYEIVSSGVVHVLESEGAQISIDDLRVSLLFRTEAGEGPKVAANRTSEQTAELILTNLEGALGFGNVEPIKLGTLGNKDLFFIYRVSSLNDSSIRTLEYTFYRNA